MSFSKILELKKTDDKTSEKKFIKNIIVGSDLFSLAIFDHIRKKDGEDSVKIIHPHVINLQTVELMGPSTLRGQDNIAKFKSLYPHIDLDIKEKVSVFFKEGKFRAFGGRSKSEKLLWNEEFYIQPRANFKIESLFPFLSDESFFQNVESARLDLQVKGVIKTTPQDMIDQAYFSLETSKGSTIECEHLFWANGPEQFLKLYSNKNELSDEFIEFCEATNGPAALVLRFDLDEPITERVANVFIPLSYTHDWGHFIGEFSSLENGKQRAEFITFIDKDCCNEEDISKKIRLLKRSLEKIYEKFQKISYQEFLRLVEFTSCLNVDDEKFILVKDQISNLHFLSENAPVKSFSVKNDSCEDSVFLTNFFTRASQNLFESLHEF